MLLEFLQQYWYAVPWFFTLLWIHFRLNRHQDQLNQKILDNEIKLKSALEKLDVGIYEVKNRTRCKLIDRNNRGKNESN